MDLILAGFELEQKAEQDKRKVLRWIWILGGLILLGLSIIGYLEYKMSRVRREIEEALIKFKIVDRS